tara:strand:+ start:1171 stop:1863 length:693 start_codon:yes stop_codon:yes gene_type:complete
MDGAYPIRLTDVGKHYREGQSRRVVFEGLTASIDRGAITAVVGRSGAGKSTLLNLLSGIDVPDTGTVEVEGVCLNELDDDSRTLFRREHIGFVFQAFNLIPTLSVRENLLLPLELKRVPKSTANQRCEDLLDRLGLADREQSFPDRLSGGEQQRVAIARALVHDPQLVLADEPTGNLDRDTGAEVLQWMTTLTHEQNKTLVIVTHSDHVVAAADVVARLVDGQLVREPVS